MTGTVSRRLLFRWTGWFAAANTLVLCFISLRYLVGIPPGQAPLTWLYVVTNYLSHHALLAAVPLLLLLTPLILAYPRRRPVLLIGVLTVSLMIALLTLDSLLWAQSRFHINLLTVRILGTPSWIFAGTMLLIGLFFESMLARGVWNWVGASQGRKGGWLGLGLGISFVLAQGIHAWADAAYYTPVTGISNHIPAYRGVTAKKLLSRFGLVDIRQNRERRIAQRMSRGMDPVSAHTLNYPLKPLTCRNDTPMNLLIIIVDALRADVVTEQVTPNLFGLAHDGGIDFREHFSGGNSSRMGHFSFFYGLPPVYFNSFASVQRPALLIDELQRQHYRLGIFSSTDLYRPAELDRTAFAGIPNLRKTISLEKRPAWERVEAVNREWFSWLDQPETKQPFFGFLYYDSSKMDSGVPEGGQPLAGNELAFAEYKTAMHFNDELIGGVLADLEQRGLKGNTVVVVSADHGEEFDERKLGYEGHGSGYSRYQLQVPLIISWPGMAAQSVEHRTSHYDVAPTLLRHLLGCTNPASDFSSGSDLFDGRQWDWIVSGSYYNYAVLEPDQITVTFPNGTFEVRDWDYQLIAKPEFRADVLQAIISENQRFHR